MTNNMYTHEERAIIIKYIIDNNIDGNLQGNALWRRMEQERVLNRTWQSMRSHFKHTIINMLHLYGLSDYQRKMILHGFGRKTRTKTSHSTRPALPKKPIPFSSDSDSDTTICDAAQASKRARRDSGSNSSLDLLAGNTNTGKINSHISATVIDRNQASTSSANCDIRSAIVNTTTSDNKPTTSTPNVKDHKRTQKQNDSVVIIDSDDDESHKTKVIEQRIADNIENVPFSLEEDTELILFFKTHQCYLADIHNNFAYVAYNYDTPNSIRTPKELRTRFVEHIMPKLFTYDCLTYEEMVMYYDRTDIDVPVEFQQLISKTVAEQKKHKQVSAPPKVTDVLIQVDNTIPEHTQAQDQPNPPAACPAVNVVRKPTMVDAATQVEPPREDKLCNRTQMVDASTQVDHGSEDKVCNTNVQIVQHVEFITDNMLHIFLPDQDQQNIYSKSHKTVHFRPRKYTLLNDKRYVDVAVDPSVRQIAIDKCETELLRLTAGVKRLEATLCKLRGYEAKGTVGEKENRENLILKHEHCTNVSATSNNTTIISSSPETLSNSEASNTIDKAESQTGNQTELMFDIFQSELDKKHISTQINASQADNTNTTEDVEQEEISSVIAIQPDIEFSIRQVHEPMEVEQTSDESEVPTNTSGCQTEPLNLSTNSDSAENVNSDKFYTAASQHDS